MTKSILGVGALLLALAFTSTADAAPRGTSARGHAGVSSYRGHSYGPYRGYNYGPYRGYGYGYGYGVYAPDFEDGEAVYAPSYLYGSYGYNGYRYNNYRHGHYNHGQRRR